MGHDCPDRGQRLNSFQRTAAAMVSRRSMSIPEGPRLTSRQINVTRFSLKYLQQWLKSQRTNHQNKWMLLNTEHFPLCLQPVVPLLLLRAWSLSMQVLTCPAGSHLKVLINTLDTGLAFCFHKLLLEIKFSSTGNAACNHYSGLTVLYGSPQNLQNKYATKDRCMSTKKHLTFIYYAKRDIAQSKG